MKALAVTASILLSVLVLGIGWLAVFPGSDVGEPVAVLQVQPAVAPTPSAAPTDGAQVPGAAPAPETVTPPAASGDLAVPPGFAVAVPPLPPAGPPPE